MPKKLTALSLLIAAISIASLPAQTSSDDTPLDLLLEQHQATIDKLDLSKAAKISKLNPKYEAALNRIKKQHQADNDFEATLAVGHELNTFAKPPAPSSPPTPAPGKPSEQLLKAKATYRLSIASISKETDTKVIAETTGTLKNLESLAKKYAYSDKLDDAIAADAAHKALEVSEDYKAAVARNAAAGADNLSPQSTGMDAALPRSGLVAHYKLDGNLRDSEGGSDITLGGKKNYAAGVDGRAIAFDNGYKKDANYIDVPLPKGGKSSFTLSFCFQADMDAHDVKTLIGIGSGADSDIVRCDFQREGANKAAIISDREDNWQQSDGGAERPGKTWYHILVTFEPELVNFYTNGRLMTTLKTKAAFDTTGMSAHIPMLVYSSKDDNGRRVIKKGASMDCLIDELAIYDRALRSNEIREIVKSYRLGQ